MNIDLHDLLPKSKQAEILLKLTTTKVYPTIVEVFTRRHFARNLVHTMYNFSTHYVPFQYTLCTILVHYGPF